MPEEPIIDSYTMARTFLDLIDQANGLPKGTTPTGTLSLDDIKEQMRHMAAAYNVLSWGIAGCIGLLLVEHGLENRITWAGIRNYTPFRNFPWQKFYRWQSITKKMLTCGCKPDPRVNPETAHAIFKHGQRGSDLSVEERRVLWEAVLANQWHTTTVQKIIRAIEDLKKTRIDGVDQANLAQICIEAAKRSVAINGAIYEDEDDAADQEVD